MDEDPVDRHGRGLAGREVAHPDALQAPVAEDLVDHGAVPHVDVRALEHAPAICLLAAEALVRVDEHHSNVMRRELERLEEGRVAASDHRDGLTSVQGAVAARAVADAFAVELVLASDAELARPRSGGDDDGGRDDLAGVGHHAPVAVARLDAHHLAHLERAAGVRDLLLDTRAELEARHALREAREVLDSLGVQDRAAGPERIDQNRAASVTRGDEGGSEPGGPSTGDRDLVVDLHAPRQGRRLQRRTRAPCGATMRSPPHAAQDRG